MLGLKLYKAELKTQEQLDHYASVAKWCNENNATIDDKGDYLEVVKCVPPVETTEDKIMQLKAELASTDYKCLKFVDGALTKKEYAEVKAYRAELRSKINELSERSTD